MLLKMFTIYDSKAEVYTPPFFFKTTGEAIRAFMDNCQDHNHMFSRHAEDFSMFEIATFDDCTTAIEFYPSNVCIARAIECSGGQQLAALSKEAAE